MIVTGTENPTKQRVLRKWLQNIGKDGWRYHFRLRMADRAGNRRKVNRAKLPSATRKIIKAIRKLEKSDVILFREQLPINGHDLIEMGISAGPEQGKIFNELLGLCVNKPEAASDRKWLLDYVRRVYIDNNRNTIKTDR